jgi:formylglycine-generating enzyme required for sulfatase activity
MRFVHAKSFKTGIDDSGSSSISTAYQIAETEVTYELWSTVYTWATANGYTFANTGTMGDGSGDTNQHPVTTINWRDAMVWTNALTEYYNAQNGTSYAVVYTSDTGYTTPIRSSVDGSYSASTNMTAGSFDNPYVNPNAKGFRLPTSDEWELAARYIDDANSDGDIMDIGEYYPGSYISGDTSNPYNTSTILGDYGWYSGNSGSSTHPVATKTANALGLYDMSGNVWEWANEWLPNWVGTNRVFRGGGYGLEAYDMQVARLNWYYPHWENYGVGFRPSRTP